MIILVATLAVAAVVGLAVLLERSVPAPPPPPLVIRITLDTTKFRRSMLRVSRAMSDFGVSMGEAALAVGKANAAMRRALEEAGVRDEVKTFTQDDLDAAVRWFERSRDLH